MIQTVSVRDIFIQFQCCPNAIWGGIKAYRGVTIYLKQTQKGSLVGST